MKTCNQCEDEFIELVQHWRQSSECERPPFDQRQRELLKGLTMGDGSISSSACNGEASMSVYSTNECWLRWLRAQFGRLATTVRLSQNGETVGENARENPGFDSSGGEWVYSNMYHVGIRSHPHLTQMRERWYPDGSIHYPEGLTLTPVAAAAWYCSDGGLSWTGNGQAYAAFGTHNEADRSEFLCELFREHGFDPNWSRPLLRFGSDETAELLSWMSPAPAGFEYKWAHESRDQYDKLKAEADQ
jgi:hypothetical protein